MGVFVGPRQKRLNGATWYSGDPVIPPNSATGLGFGSSLAPSVANSAESALRKIAVWGATNLIAGVISSLPVDGFSGDGATKRGVSLPRFFENPDGSGQGLSDWVYQYLFSCLLRGNGFGYIGDTDVLGRPTLIKLIHPDRVSYWERREQFAPVQETWHFEGSKVDNDRVWHRRVHSVPGQMFGLSVVRLHATTIGQGLAAAAFGYRWFTDGAHPSAILQNTSAEKITDSQATGVKRKFLNAIWGTREPLVLGSGWTYQAIQVSPEESQFLDTQQYTSAECARIFGPGVAEVLGYPTGDSKTYANVEQRAVDLLRFTIGPWLTHIERVLSELLPKPRYVKFNRDALLATDLLTRYRAHQIAISSKFTTPDEVRELEDMPPLTPAQKDELTTAPTVAPPTQVEQVNQQ